MASKLNTVMKNFWVQKPVRLNHKPGSLQYTGEYTNTPITFELVIYDEQVQIEKKNLDFEGLQKALEGYNYLDPKSPNIWVNVVGLNHVGVMDDLMAYFQMPKFMMEEILTIHYHSKYIQHHEHLFHRLQMIWLKDGQVANESLSLYNHQQLLISFQEEQGDVFDGIRQRIKEGNSTLLSLSTTYLHYSMMSTLLEHYQTVIHLFNQKLDGVEQAIVDDESIDQNELHQLRKGLLLLKTTIFPLENCSKMYPVESKAHEESLQVRWRKIDGQVSRLASNITVARELTNSLYETQMMNMSNDMNKVMTTLTIFSAIFIPLSFLAGVFGMNFAQIPMLNQPYGFMIFIISCCVISLGMIAFFKKNEWF